MSETTPAQAPTPVADLSYEQARDELVTLVSRIESGQVPLEEAMALWERGEELAAHCQDKLDAAQASLDRSGGREPGGQDPAGAASQTEDGTAEEDTAEEDTTEEDTDGRANGRVSPAG